MDLQRRRAKNQSWKLGGKKYDSEMTSPRSTASESLKFQKEVTEYAVRDDSHGYSPEHCLQLKGISSLLCE